MTRKNLMLVAAFGSLALLLGAFGFQVLGYAPCKLCLWQRWPHAAAIAVGGLVLMLGPLVLLGLAGALAALTTSGIGAYHTGVERGWWPGPTSCTGGGNALDGLSGQDLLSLDGPTGVVMCDEVAWAFAGLSMASWNALASLALALIWLSALRYPRIG
ncbi:MAG: disulfide bond formation protein B [Silicimonas sp.]|jgi:disulfide bond formation protein DsbB|nr:disulfide bond formation protein B [Silicimonas sp.]